MKTSITLSGERIHVASGYNPIFVTRFRTIEGRKFDGDTKLWTFPKSKDALLAVCDVTGTLAWMLAADLQAVLADEGVKPPEAKAVDIGLVNGHVFLTTPFEHQRANLARLLQEPRWLIADEMGTGKTHAIVNRIKILSDDLVQASGKCLILCPKSVVQGWHDELLKHGPLKAQIIEGSKDKRDKLLNDWLYCLKIANYELLLHSDFSIVDWDVVVCDEIHRVKSFTAQTSKKVRQLTEKARCVWGLSGTPAPNGLQDWHGVLAAIKPGLLPVRTKTAFEARYCVKQKIQPNIWKVAGYKNVAELHGYIASITSRVTKEDCLDLPPKVFSVRRGSMEGEQARVYREIKKDAVARILTAKREGTLTVRNVLTESLRLLQITGGFLALDDGGMHELPDKAKVKALAETLEDIGEKQVVIWSAFRPEVAWLTAWLEEHHGRCAVLTGGVTGPERTEAIESFKRGDARFFVGTAAAGGTGINGLSVADTEIYYSRDFNFATYSQSVDRLHRIGQTRTVNIIKLLASGTIDETVDRKLDEKGDMMATMLTNPEEFF